MPRVEVPADATNKNILTLLGNAAPPTGWVHGGKFHADPDNTATLKIGGSGMTADDYDTELESDEEVDIAEGDRPVFLRSKYVRNDGVGSQYLIINFQMS